MKKFLIALGLVFLVGSSSFVRAMEFPDPTGHVNDFAGILSESFEGSLEANIAEFEKETTVEIAVATVTDLAGTTIEGYGVRLFEAWGIGKKEADNGLLILVALNERKVRIDVGYGLEPIITDSRAGRIIREKITPEFKNENYEQGLLLGVEAIKDYYREGEKPLALEKTETKVENSQAGAVFGLLVLVYLSSFWGRSKRIWPGGVVGGILGMIIGAIAKIAILPWIFALIGFFLDWLLSKNYKNLKKAGRPTRWWLSRGGFRTGRSSGGGFGGFGGGSSGGGGASGSW